MKKYKKIYIEITNICNLSCSFCSIDNRKKESITLNNMEEILKKINAYTDYIYLHVKGEPLLHTDLKEIFDLCQKYNKQVNITTNGTLLKERKDILLHDVVRQVNISLHSENKKENYLEEILDTIDYLKEKIIVLRFWTINDGRMNKESTKIVEKIKIHYSLSPKVVEKIKNDKHIKIRENLYIDKAEKFIWPDINNDYYNENGTCYALRDQLAILSDGSVVPCCLDSNNIINLGNIYKQNLNDIINSNRYKKMKQAFANHKSIEELCRHCSFKDNLKINQR